jgi:hypothetical protein
VAVTYSEVSDLILGNIPTPANAQKYVDDGADEIDARIGFKYATPIAVGESAEERPVRLLLKRINNWLASGRLIMALDGGGEDDQLHQYGLYLVTEANKTLDQIVNGEIVLPGVDPSSPTSEIVTGPQMSVGDEYSLVEGFDEIFGNPAKISIERTRIAPVYPYPIDYIR